MDAIGKQQARELAIRYLNLMSDLLNSIENDFNAIAAFTDTATSSSAGLMSADDKQKLVDIEDSAQVNVIESVKVNNTALPVSNKAVNIDLANATVKSAASLNSSQSLKVSLNSTSAQSFNGSSAATVIGVGGTLPVANGGTGVSNLDSITVGGANRDGDGNVIKNFYVSLADFNKKINALRFGYRIKKSEPNPYERVEYIYDAVGMTPAKMVYDTNSSTAATANDAGHFDYGSWADVWFVSDNKALMLKSDGSVDYFLNPNDYSKKTNGAASDISNSSYDGNAMAQIPLCWVYRYETDRYQYEIVSNIQYDENYKAYAHTDASGSIKPYCYHSIFGGSLISSKIRSLSGQNLFGDLTSVQCISAAKANGSGWNITYWSQRELLRTLLVLMGKSTNTQAVFGNGTYVYSDIPRFQDTTGELNTKGQFFGFNTTTRRVKVFHTECFWGERGYRLNGITTDNWKVYVKMTPQGDDYRAGNVNGYSYVSTIQSNNNTDFIKSTLCNQYGMIPVVFSGASSSTYFCDALVANSTNAKVVAIAGGIRTDVLYGGAFYIHLCYGHNETAPAYYALLSYV